ncbi:MAG: MFS transporter [Nanoarchaeota archaeon]|nr:MFS transporter [Nanoarchaeota archaeon]
MGKRSVFLSFFAFWVFCIVFKFGTGLHYTLIAPLGERLLPLWIVGLVMSIASIIQLVLDIPAGNLLDRFGYRNLLAVGTGIFMVAVLLWLKTDALFFVGSVLLASFGWLFFGPGRNAYVLAHATKQESGKFLGFRDVFSSLGTVLACLTIPFLIVKPNNIIVAVLFGLLACSLIAILLSPRDKKHMVHADFPHERTHHQRRHLFRNICSVMRRLSPASTLLLALQFVAALFYGVVWFVIPLVIAHAVNNASILGVGLGMFDFAVVIAGSLLCTLVDKVNKKLMIFVGLFIFSFAGLLLGWSFGLLFLLFAFLSTTGDEIASLPLWAWLHQLDKRHNRDGLISGVINLFEDLGWTVGPLVAGILYVLVGPTMTLVLGALPLLVLFGAYYFVVQKHMIKVSLFAVPVRPHKARHKN